MDQLQWMQAQKTPAFQDEKCWGFYISGTTHKKYQPNQFTSAYKQSLTAMQQKKLFWSTQ